MKRALGIRLLPIAYLIIVWFIFASPYFLKGFVPFPSKYLVTFFPPWSAAFAMPVKNNAMPDIITQIYPWKQLTIESWKQKTIPLWNPYSFSGTSHGANYQTAVFSPINLLFFVLAQVDAWSLMILLQPLLAGLFSFIFLRSIGRSRFASVVGSIAFMFSGFIVVWMAYGTLGYAILWLPLLLFAIHRQMKRASWWNLLLVALIVPLSFFSGHFQISLYLVGFALMFLLYETVKTKQWVVGLWIALFFVLGVVMSFPQLLPSLAAYKNSVRSMSFGTNEVIPWPYLMTIVAPDFFGNAVTRNDWFGHYAEWASFIGVIPLFLALYAVVGKKGTYEWFFGAVGVMVLLLALRTPVSDLLFRAKLPVVSTSAASRIIVLVSFCLSVLSSFGWDKLSRDWIGWKTDRVKYLTTGVILFFSLTWVLLLFGSILPEDKVLIAKRNFILPTVIAGLFILLTFAGFTTTSSLERLTRGFVGPSLRRHKIVQLVIMACLLLLVSFDMLRFALKWMPFDPKELVYPSMSITTYLQKTVGIDRVFGNFGNELSTYFSIPSIEGYDALYQARYGEFISTATRGTITVPERSVVTIEKYGVNTESMLQLLGVRYILHRLSDGRSGWAYPVWSFPADHYRSIYRDEHYEVFENTKALPRAYLASSYSIATQDAQIIDSLFSKAYNPREHIVLEKKPIIDPQEGAGEIGLKQYSPNVIDMEVTTDVPKLLFLSDTYDPGWKAYVDGSPAPVYRANFVFRAVPVPKGIHLVRMKYEPESVFFGLRIALLVGGVLIFFSIKKLFYDYRHI